SAKTYTLSASRSSLFLRLQSLASSGSFHCLFSVLVVDSVNLEIVEFDHVIAHHFSQDLYGQMAQFPSYNVARVGPGGRGMGIVMGPHKSVLAEIFHQTPACRIAKKRCVNLILHILTGQLFHIGQRRFGAVANKILVPFMNEKRNPADLVLDVDEF